MRLIREDNKYGNLKDIRIKRSDVFKSVCYFYGIIFFEQRNAWLMKKRA